MSGARPGPYLLQGLEDTLSLSQLLDAQGYLVAGTFGDILKVKKGQDTENGRLRHLGGSQRGIRGHLRRFPVALWAVTWDSRCCSVSVIISS